MADSVLVPYSLDDYFQSTPIGSLDKAIGNNIYGFNHRQVPNAAPSNKELAGYTFFVRPQLNMQSDNVRNIRQMAALLNQEPMSIQRMVRCVLDPRLQVGYTFKTNKIPSLDCPVVDPTNAFIPFLSNNLNSISGWPDITAPVCTSPPGLYNEAHSMVDGISRNFESWTADATFKNTSGDPILYLFYNWIYYMSYVFEGKLVPYLDFITENEIDYDTRIYRVLVDKNRNKVTKIMSTICFPISVPVSASGDFNKDRPFSEQNKDITIRFQCMGLEIYDDILIREFNDTGIIFCPDMADDKRDKSMTRVPDALGSIFNHRGIPRINPSTHELEWWVPSDLYAGRVNAFLKSGMLGAADYAIIDSAETGD